MVLFVFFAFFFNFTQFVIKFLEKIINLRLGTVSSEGLIILCHHVSIVSHEQSSVCCESLTLVCARFFCRPFSGKEENTLRAKRQSLLSEVIFVPATPSSEVSALKQEEDNRFVNLIDCCVGAQTCC